MPQRTCSVCGHRDVAVINKLLIEREPLRKIERRFKGVSRAALSRHNAHVPVELRTAAIEVQPLQGTLVEQVRQVAENMRRIIAKAEHSGHLQVASNTLKSLTGALELIAKLEGELSDAPINQINVGVQVDARAFVLSQIDAIAGRVNQC